jgi:polysaccharide biosynthesis PFTS motif protein
MFLNLKKKYEFLSLLNSTRALAHLINNQKGEEEIRTSIEELLKDNTSGFDVPLKQKILRKSLDRNLGPALMLASAGNKFPILVRLPKEWRVFLISKNMRLHPLSGALWWLEIVQSFRHAIAVYRKLLVNNQPSEISYAVLMGIHTSAFSSTLSGTPAEDFLSWFRSFFPFAKQWIVPTSVSSVSSTNATFIADHPFPSLPPRNRRDFKRNSLKHIVFSILKLCKGDWKSVYMLSDFIEAEYVRNMPPDHLAGLYGFTNAEYIYRPLWTYEAEKRGAEIALFFYSINTFNMKLVGGHDLGYAPGYKTMTWPVIYTQHENHVQFLKEIVNDKTEIRVAGLIPYEDNGLQAECSGNIKILYLDVQPFRPAFMASIGRPCYIYTEAVSRQSLQDILAAAKKIQATLYIKQKRSVGNRLSPSYRKMLSEAEESGYIKIIDSGISPKRLCKEVDYIICQPFTSASLSAKALGKPVAYYDAPSFFEKNQPASMGVPLLQGVSELEHWLSEAKNVSKTAA